MQQEKKQDRDETPERKALRAIINRECSLPVELSAIINRECSLPIESPNQTGDLEKKVIVDIYLGARMEEVADLPLSEIATPEYFSSEGFTTWTAEIYRQNPHLERIVDCFKTYATESGVRVPRFTLRKSLDALRTYGAGFSPGLCDEIAEVLSSKGNEQFHWLIAGSPFVKYPSFWSNVFEPYLIMVQYATNFGEEFAKEIVHLARGKIVFLVKNIRYQEDTQMTKIVAQYCIDNIFDPLREIDPDIVPQVIRRVLGEPPHFFSENLHDTAYNLGNCEVYLSLVSEAHEISKEAGRVVTKDSPPHLGFLREENLSSRYILAIRGVATIYPSLVEAVSGDFFTLTELIKEKRPFDIRPRVFTPPFLDIYVLAASKSKKIFGRSRRDLLGVIQSVAEMSETNPEYITPLKETMERMPNENVLERWVNSAKAILSPSEHMREDIDVFLRYRFKEVYGKEPDDKEPDSKKPLLDEIALFPLALIGNGDCSADNQEIETLYAAAARYERGDEKGTGPYKQELRTLLHAISYLTSAVKPLSEDAEAYGEVLRALEEAGTRRNRVISGIERLRIRKKVESEPRSIRNLRQKIGEEESKILSSIDYSQILTNPDTYSRLSALRRLGLQAKEDDQAGIDSYIESNATGLLEDLIYLLRDRSGDSMPRLEEHLGDLHGALAAVPVQEVKARLLLRPHQKIINGIGACVFEREKHGPELPLRSCFEASIAYAMDPDVHLIMLTAYGKNSRGDLEKTDLAVAILVDLAEGGLLIDGVIPNRNRKAGHVVTTEGHTWKDIMLKSIRDYALAKKVRQPLLNVCHGDAEPTDNPNEFVKYMMEDEGYKYEEDFYFDSENGLMMKPGGPFIYAPPGAPPDMPPRIDTKLWRVEQSNFVKRSHERPAEETLYYARSFYHSWRRANRGRKNSFWNDGHGEVRFIGLCFGRHTLCTNFCCPNTMTES